MYLDVYKKGLLVLDKGRGSYGDHSNKRKKKLGLVEKDEVGYTSFAVEDIEGYYEDAIRLYCGRGCNFDFKVDDIVDIKGVIDADQEGCQRIMDIKVSEVIVKKRLSELESYHRYISRRTYIKQSDIYRHSQSIYTFLSGMDNSRDYSALLSVIDDLVINVYDHAFVKYDEYYTDKVDAIVYSSYDINNSVFIFSVRDKGFGIIRRIKEKYGFEDKTNEEVLGLAVTERFSTSCQPHNKGLGLFNTKQLVQSCGGEMFISNSKGVFQVNNEVVLKIEDSHRLDVNGGTIVEIAIPINNLPLLEYLDEADICS